MTLLRYILPIAVLCAVSITVNGQSACPPNVDFEQGSLSNWTFYIGSNNGASGLSTLSSTAPLTNRHVLTSGAATDYYGGFPIVAPGGGSYSLKLGNNSTGAQVDQARYSVTVPAGSNNYSLIYRYAVVFEDPQHPLTDQPFFRVRVYNAATNAVINCSYYNYVSQNGLPGFLTSTYGSNVYYRNWTTGSLNLTGQAGNTLTVEFTAADCSQGGHFGYGYVDMTCGLFSVLNSNCIGAATTPLSAPAGFQTYTWYNSTYSSVIGTGMNISIPTPGTLSTYHVILTPYPGYGCTDTLTTQVANSALTVNAGPDTMVCNNPGIQLGATINGNVPPFTYSWAPAAGLSSTSIINPVAAPVTATDYILTVTDGVGCVRSDTINVKAPVAVANTTINVSCFGGNNGSSIALASQGTGPYTYSWNTAQTTAAVTGLTAGSYIVTATDSKGCTKAQNVTVTQPPLLTATAVKTNVACYGGITGTATVTATGGTAPYAYSWNTTPVQTAATTTALPVGTYTVTVTDAKGCIATSTVIITQPPLFAGTTTATAVFCNGGATGTATVSATGGVAPFTYSWNTTPPQTAATATNLAAGTYIATITDNNGCSVTASAVVTQPPLLTVTASKTDVGCNGNSTGTATAAPAGGTAPYSYSWNTTPAQTTATATNLGAGTYTVSITDNKGCIATAQVTIVQPLPLAATVVKTDVSCNGGSNGTATVTATGGTGPYTYSWNTVPAQTMATVTGLAAGSYTVTVTDSHSCIITSTTTITQPLLLTAITTKTDVSCNGGANGTATVVVAGGTAPYTYSWNAPPIQTTAVATGLAAGNYNITVTDNKGCTATAAATISQPLLLQMTVATLPVSCFGGTNSTATATVTGGTGPYTYVWDNSSSLTGPSIGGLGAGSHTVTVTDANGCTHQTPFTVTQPLALSGTVSITPVTCYGQHTATATITVAGGKLPYTYSWNTSPPQLSPTATALGPGTYSVTVTDSNNCTYTSTAIIPALPAVTGAATAVNVSCNGLADGSATMTVNGATGTIAHHWYMLPVQSAATATGLAAGTYTDSITYGQGCYILATATVTQPPALQITASELKPSCPDVANGGGFAVATGGTGSYSYLWGSIPAQAGDTLRNVEGGAYSVTVTDQHGCSKTTTVQISLYAAPVVAAGPDTTYCEGRPITLTATGAATYLWSPAQGLSCTACAAPLASPGSTTTYTIIGTDAHACKDTGSITVTTILHTPTAAGPERKICVGDTIHLDATGGVQYAWSPAASLNDATMQQPVAQPDVTTDYTVLVTSSSCFTDTRHQKVVVLPYPTVNAGPDITGISNTSITLKTNITNATSITWSPATDLSCSTCAAPTVQLNATTTYIVEASNELGCRTRDTVNIIISCSPDVIYMANTFTPNADGQNDRFYPQSATDAIIKHFMVYDRWGEVVFAAHNFVANNASLGWDGTFHNTPLKPDVYVYVVETTCADGSPIIVKGDVTLLR